VGVGKGEKGMMPVEFMQQPFLPYQRQDLSPPLLSLNTEEERELGGGNRRQEGGREENVKQRLTAKN